MATRACKVTLRKPIGINNFQGKSFRCFARGDTLPFYLEFRYTDGNPVDITGWRCIVAFTNSLSCSRPGCGDSSLVLEVDIPIHDAENGIFAGNVTNEHTKDIPCGLVYATIKYITAPNMVEAQNPDGSPMLNPDGSPAFNPPSGVSAIRDEPPALKGLSYILDMCQLEVYPSVAPST